jgi:hypothetical protein
VTDNITPMSLNQPIITTVKTHLEVTCDPAFDEAWINGVRYVPAPDRPAVTPAAVAPDRPLWLEMRDAYVAAPASSAPTGYASELRVVADWLKEKHYSDPVVHTAWEAAQWLRDEAERANNTT